MESYFAANFPNGVFSSTSPRERQKERNSAISIGLSVFGYCVEIFDSPRRKSVYMWHKALSYRSEGVLDFRWDFGIDMSVYQP